VVFIAHCILNQNVRYAGGAHYPAMIDEVIDVLKAHRVGLVQIPCPEFTFAGLNRSQRTKEEYDTPGFREHCERIAAQMADEVEEYARSGFKVLAVLGVERSPTCGVEQTTTRLGVREGETRETTGRGVLIEELGREFTSRHLQVPLEGVDWRKLPEDVERLAKLLSPSS